MTKRDRIMLCVIAVVAVAGAFQMLVLKPIKADLAGLDERRAQADQRRDAAVADLNAATSARESYRRDSATLALLGKAVPADDGVPSLLYQIEGAAKAAGVAFDAVKLAEGGSSTAAAATPAPAAGSTTGAAGDKAAADPVPGVSPGPEGLSVLPVKITFQGDFFSVGRFLDRVHRFARLGDERVDIRGRLLTVEGVSLTPGTTGLPSLKAEINAQAYVSPTTPATGAAGTGSATTASTTTTTPTGSGETR